MSELVNSFTLSNSQITTSSECLRKYWFSRYGSWGGWISGADERTKEIYRLKRLTGVYLWTGNRVHELIQEILTVFVETGIIMPEEAAVEKLRETLRNEYRQSLTFKKGENFPKGVVRFIEHDDDSRAIPPEKWKEVTDRAIDSIRGFYRSGVYSELINLPPTKLARENAIVRKDDVLETILVNVDGRNVPVYVTIDVLMRDRDSEKYLVVDWKTGKEKKESHDKQLGIYAMFVEEKFGAPPENISFAPVYLGYTPDKMSTITFTREKAKETEEWIRSSARELLKRIEDPDKGVALEEKFPTNPGKFRCDWCEYKTVCPK